MTAVKAVVFDQKKYTLGEFHRIITDDFADHEELRQQIINSLPKYGNDDDCADAQACEWAEFLASETESHIVGLHRYVPGFFCWVMHERLGSETGATPDGRKSGLPLADGAGPAQGRELNGPTAAVLSSTKWSHRKALGGLVHNIKFSGNILRMPEARDAMIGVLETYLKRGGLEIQVNVVGKDVLIDAQKHPEQYADLVVRVAGYSDYFTHLNRKMQDEVISRTEHDFARP
jgi:formate C-acetyltransferase